MTTTPAGVDLVALERHLAETVPGGVRGPLRIELIPGGKSNLTYTLRDDVHDWVLRRPPLGHVLPTAHDMAREYRVMSALRDSPVPVPAMVTSCQDPGVLGAPFYVMERVDGTIYRERDMDTIATADATVMSHAVTDVLAELHLLDYAARGLADFGRPDGFLQRQVRRWGRQYDASRSRDLPMIDRLGEQLDRNIPPSRRTALVHGDYRLDNVVIAPGDPGTVAAVLDWEMATLGDPLADFGLYLAYWDGIAGEVAQDVAARMTAYPGFLSTERMIDHYFGRTGFDAESIRWYHALAQYKMAIIVEGIYYRNTQGLTVGEGFDDLGDIVALIAEKGLDLLG